MGSRFAAVRQLPLHRVLHYEYSYFLLLYVIGINQLDYYFFYRLLTGYSKLKISGARTFHPSVKVSWTDLYYVFYDGWQGLQMWVLHAVVILMYTDGFRLL